MPSSNCIPSPRYASARRRRPASFTRKRASGAWPGTRYFSMPSHSSNQSAGPMCSSAMPTVYSGTLLMGQFSRWSLLTITRTSGRAASSRCRISAVACSASRWYSSEARVNHPVSPGEWVMAIAATISATRGLQPLLQGHRARRLLGERAPVALERRARVAVLRVAEEQPEDLGDVVLVDAEVHQPPGIAVADGLVLRAAEPELAGEALEVGEPARAQRGVLAHVVHHLVRRERLVAALDVAHHLRTFGFTFRNMITQRSVPRLRTSCGTLCGNFTIEPAGTTTSSPAMLMLATPSSTKIASSSRGWLCMTVDWPGS